MSKKQLDKIVSWGCLGLCVLGLVVVGFCVMG